MTWIEWFTDGRWYNSYIDDIMNDMRLNTDYSYMCISKKLNNTRLTMFHTRKYWVKLYSNCITAGKIRSRLK